MLYYPHGVQEADGEAFRLAGDGGSRRLWLVVAAGRSASGGRGRLSGRLGAARRRGERAARLARRRRYGLPPLLPCLARRLGRQGACRVRGPALLHPFRRERAERAPGLLPERHLHAAHLGRVYDHDAGHAPLPSSPAHARLEVRGGVPRDADGACARQDVDRLAISQPRAVRVEPRGRGGGGERLVRQAGEGPRHRRGGAFGGHGAMSLAFPPGPTSRPSPQAARVRAGADVRARDDRRGPARRRARFATGNPARAASVRGAVFLRLGAAARRARGRPARRRADDAGRRLAGAHAPGGRDGVVGRRLGGGRGDGSADGRRARARVLGGLLRRKGRAGEYGPRASTATRPRTSMRRTGAW